MKGAIAAGVVDNFDGEILEGRPVTTFIRLNNYANAPTSVGVKQGVAMQRPTTSRGPGVEKRRENGG